MAAPLMKSCEKIFDGLVLGPEIAVELGDVRDGAGPLFSHELF
jgi:hypothetical protein